MTSRFRFSLMGLIGAVAFAAFACAALRYASELWASAALSVTVAVLLGAILGLLLARQESRAFWPGTVVFGWGYMLLVLGPGLATTVGPNLLTSRLLTWLHPRLVVATNPGPGVPSVVSSSSGSSSGGEYSLSYQMQVMRMSAGSALEHFLLVGHSLLAILIALGGGVLARMIDAGRRGALAQRVQNGPGTW